MTKSNSYLGKVSPILPGWPMGGGSPPAVLREFPSKEAYQRWYKGTYADLAELDQSLNECRFFVRSREDRMKGCYVRDDVSLPCFQWWRGAEFEKHYADVLKEKGWQDNWWQPREGR